MSQELTLLLREARDTIDSLPGYPKGADLCDRIDAALARTHQPEAAQVVAPKLIGWRTDNFLWETDDIDTAKNWEPNIGVLPIFEGDPNTKICTATQREVDALRDSLAAKADRIDRLGETVERQQAAHRAVMSRLAEMLDEDQFTHIEDIVSRSGVTPPQAEQPAQVVPEAAIAEAVKEAVAAIYFADSADYKPALWSVVKALAPDLAELLETNESAAYHQADSRLLAASQHGERK